MARLLLILLAAGLLTASISAQPSTLPATQPAQTPAAVISIRGAMNDYTYSSIDRDLSKAIEQGAETVILELNTPGGLVSGKLFDLTRRLRGLEGVQTIAYIDPRAYSAGTMLALACDEIIMASDAAIGDCAPISTSSTGEVVPLPETERAKAASPILADFLSSARQNGYAPLLAEAMIQVQPSIYLLENDRGEYRPASGDEYQKLIDSGEWRLAADVYQPVDGPQTLLTVHTDIALKLGLAAAEFRSVEQLAQARNLAIIQRMEPDFGEQLIGFVSDNAIRGVLLTIFLISLYLAINTPGHGLAEAVAMVSLGLAVGVPLLTGYAQWWEIAAIILGIVLLAVELFLIPGFGVAGISGILLIMGGLLLTFVGPLPGRFPISIPEMPATWQQLQNGLTVITLALLASLLLGWWLRRYLPRMPYFNRLILTTTVGSSDAAMVGSLSNIEPGEAVPAVGATGRAVTDLRPGGSAEFHDPAGNSHLVSVVSDSGFVLHGSAVVVREVGGSRIVVRPAKTQASA